MACDILGHRCEKMPSVKLSRNIRTFLPAFRHYFSNQIRLRHSFMMIEILWHHDCQYIELRGIRSESRFDVSVFCKSFQ